jgi:hypothetical protein
LHAGRTVEAGVSDQRLRDLERRWHETGAITDEAAFLRERVRAGALARDRLELAAYCGHEAARQALEQIKATRVGLRKWAVGLRRWGGEAATRGAVAAARAASTATRDLWSDGRVDSALARAEDWARCPCEEHAREAQQAALDALEAFIAAPIGAARDSASACIAAAKEIGFSGGPRHVTPWGDTESVGIEDGAACAASALKAIGTKGHEKAVRDRISQELSAWALGVEDPIMKRCSTR